MANPIQPGSILAISSHVVRGTVGNRAAALALEALGHPVWSLPTITLPWHPGRGPAHPMVPDDTAFALMVEDLQSSPWSGELRAVMSGYMASTGQVDCVARLVQRLKEKNPDLIYLCDPVLGDFVNPTTDTKAGSGSGVGSTITNPWRGEGKLYIDETIANAIRTQLIPLADITTPNRFELGWLGGQQHPQSIKEVVRLARKLGLGQVLVTSIPAMMMGAIGTLLLDGEHIDMAEHPAVADAPNGLGDLTSALFLSHSLRTDNGAKALEITASSVYEVLNETCRLGEQELALERNLNRLVRPSMKASMRKIKASH